MKRVLFPAVLVATILGGCFLAYAIWKASPVSAQDFLNSGKKYYEQKKYSEATVQLLNAIQKDPRNREARYLLALSYFNQKNLNAAAKELNTLLEYFPDDIDANLQLGNIYLTAGRTDSKFFRQAQELAGKILSKEPDDVGGLVLLGNASAGLQDYGSSVGLFEKALSLDPQNSAAFISLGTAQALQKKYPEAEQAFLKALQVNPKDRNALIAVGNYYRAVRDSARAEVAWKNALSIYPADKEIYLQAIEFYYQVGRFEEVERILQQAQAKNAQDPEPSLTLADLYTSRNRLADARQLLLELKDKFPGNMDVVAKLAVGLLQDQPDRARTEIDHILKADPNNPVGHILLGELQFFSGHYEEAEVTLEKDPAISSSYPQPHFFLGNIALRKGRIDEAQNHYQKSLALNSGYLPARVSLAEVLLNKGRIADSREEIRKVLETNAGFLTARLLKARLDTSEKRYSEAEQELMALIKDQPANPQVHRQMGLYYDSRARTADAEKSLSRAFELQPDSQEILQDLTQFYIRGKQTDLAIQKINTVPDNRKEAYHYEMMGLVYFQAGRLQDAERAYKKALEKDPNRTSSDVYLFAEYVQSGRLDEGVKKLDELIKKNPFNASAYAVKGSIYRNQGKIEEAKKSYSQALNADPNYDGAANNFAYILAEEGRDLDTALSWAQMARKKQSEDPNYADTLGWIHYKLKNYLLARDQLQFAVSRQLDNPVFQYHLAMIYKETKQIAEAQKALKKALSSPKDFKERILAQAAMKEIASLK